MNHQKILNVFHLKYGIRYFQLKSFYLNANSTTPNLKVNNAILSSLQVKNKNIAKEESDKTSNSIDVKKFSLTDNYDRYHNYLRISLTERCNLRCKYCMPAEGVQLSSKSNLLTTEEILYLTKIFVKQGVRKIRLTGGEPTVRKDIVNIIEEIKNIPNIENVGITTNGLMLTRLLVPMQRAGLDSINISLDTLKPTKYEKITRRKGWERVLAGIDLAIQLGYKPKINCVLMRNFNDDEICDFIEFTKHRNCDIRFIEYMPFTGNKWQTDKMVSFVETIDIIKNKWPDLEKLPNGPNDTSKSYKIPNYVGQIGFITSMTNNFCGTCNRLRLTADGNLKVCLFGNKEISLRDAIRNNCSENDLITLISTAIKRKKKQHADTNVTFTSIKKNISWNSASSIDHIFPSIHPYLFLSKPIKINLATTKSRYYSTSEGKYLNNFTHVDEDGKAKMINISNKDTNNRFASAKGIVYVGPEIARLIYQNNISKGDVLSIAQIAGILGAKKTSELIPLCHNITLSSVNVSIKLNLNNNEINILSFVNCIGRTGVEMEAITAVAIAALTVYDMCKAISHDIIIKDICLMEKTGGKRDFKRSSNGTKIYEKEEENVITLKYKTDIIDKNGEYFYPAHI